MSDTRMINQIAWWLHADCLDVDSEEDYKTAAQRIVDLVRRHDQPKHRICSLCKEPIKRHHKYFRDMKGGITHRDCKNPEVYYTVKEVKR